MKQRSLRVRLLIFIIVVMMTPIMLGSYIYYQYETTLSDADTIRQQSTLKLSQTQGVIHSFHEQSIAWANFLHRGHKPDLYNTHLREFYNVERQTYLQTQSLSDSLNQSPKYSVDISPILTKMENLRRNYRKALDIYNLSDDPYFDTDHFIAPFTINVRHDLQQLIHQIEALEKKILSALNVDIDHKKNLFLLVILLFLLGAIIAFLGFFDLNIGRPITAAISTAKRIADGDIHSRIKEDSTREFAVFSVAFNYMIDNLELVNKKLEKKIHQLETEVYLRKIAERKIFEQNQDLKTSSKTIELARQEAVSANQAKSEFLSSMSHELRTPLNAILGFGQLLEMKFDEASDNEARLYIKDIIEGGHYLLELINEVLDLSRIEAGYLDISPKPITLYQAITECMTQIDVGMAKQRNIPLITQIDDKDIAILADPMRFRQVIMNLLSNAVKYNHEGGTVTIKAKLVDKERLRIAITDTGDGIAAADMDKLFDPFERLAYKNSNVVGTGIGLTVTKQLVEAMNGTIGVESAIGQGSTFWVELPRAEEMALESVTDAESSATTSTVTERQCKILYIEDNPANTRFVVEALNCRKGDEVFTSPTAEEGLTLAEEVIPDIILMDINLPEIDGFAALKILRNVEATRHIPVIAVSANAMESDIQKAIEAGFNDYLTKPINIKQLYAVIKKYITVSTTT